MANDGSQGLRKVALIHGDTEMLSLKVLQTHYFNYLNTGKYFIPHILTLVIFHVVSQYFRMHVLMEGEPSGFLGNAILSMMGWWSHLWFNMKLTLLFLPTP